MSTVELRGVKKRYGNVEAIHNLDLSVAEGEFCALLGPSGCGKSTLLRMIAGLEVVTAGSVWIGGVDVTNMPPAKRRIAMVFQSYALYPHMTVKQNIGFSLKVAKAPKDVMEKRVREVAHMLRLEELLDRRPAQLSGGQRQRVALARALVNGPKVLLLDEPLGALDLKLRQEMQIELKRIQRDIGDGITFIFVTHDQDEALTMSDRIAVFNHGRIEQIGTPAEIYEHPHTEFVAGFVGISNVLERNGRRITVRPEKIHMREGDGPGEPGHIRDVVYLGMVTRYIVELDAGGELVVVKQNLETSSQEALEARGRRVRLEWQSEHSLVISEEGDQS